jgi:hypothetical protein
VETVGVVSEAVAIAGRGVALFCSVSPTELANVPALEILVTRPDGIASSFSASREFARKKGVPGCEVITLFVRGVLPSDVPVGSVVNVASPSGA